MIFEPTVDENFDTAAVMKIKSTIIGMLGIVSDTKSKKFGIKQQVLYADIFWDVLIDNKKSKVFAYNEISKFPSVQRDLALVVNKNVTYAQVELAAASLKIPQLQSTRLFDIFESEKLGAGKKSMAVNFSFADSNKTLTDAEIDEMINKLIAVFSKQLDAEIRK